VTCWGWKGTFKGFLGICGEQEGRWKGSLFCERGRRGETGSYGKDQSLKRTGEMEGDFAPVASVQQKRTLERGNA
jgi:hypothetical protein